MKKKVRTLYNPAVGCRYYIVNRRTGKKFIASTLTVRDKEQKPWRSPKGTPFGQEFFKMKLGSKKEGFEYIIFMNSSMNKECVSDDKKWEFTGESPNGTVIPRLDKEEKIKPKKIIKQRKTKAKKEESEEEVKSEPVSITEDIFSSQFINKQKVKELIG